VPPTTVLPEWKMRTPYPVPGPFVFPRATVPVASVPMKLPWIVLLAGWAPPAVRRMPPPVLPAITFPAPVSRPPV